MKLSRKRRYKGFDDEEAIFRKAAKTQKPQVLMIESSVPKKDFDDDGDLLLDDLTIIDNTKESDIELPTDGESEKIEESDAENNMIENVSEISLKRKNLLEIEHFSSKSAWEDLHLSKPILRALAEMKFLAPTNVQKATIPLALNGKDLLVTAQTGSGKTAAFCLPILERLCRSLQVRARRLTPTGPVGGAYATKALILLPSRELAVQCFNALDQMAKHTGVLRSLVTGGLNRGTQESNLKHQPDIVVATPGRVLDLLMNSSNVHMELLEIVVFDEADRLLDLGFKSECLSVLERCSPDRQTMLCSATLSETVQDLASLSLRNPSRVESSGSHCLPAGLQQIVARVPGQSCEDCSWPLREAALLWLCTDGQNMLREAAVAANTSKPLPTNCELLKDFREQGRGERKYKFDASQLVSKETLRTIVFFRTKKSAHRAALIFRFLNIPHAELHGNMTQAQRLAEIQKFTEKPKNNASFLQFLLCSELAARGLDLEGVDMVLNFAVPGDASKYVHQVGRTARMGNSGIAVTFHAKDEIKGLNKIIKTAAKGSDAPPPFVFRTDEKILKVMREKIAELEPKIREQIKEEIREAELRRAEMEADRAVNIAIHRDEILRKPKKVFRQRNPEEIKKLRQRKKRWDVLRGERRKKK